MEEQWYTVAYVPQVPTEKGPCGAERSRLRRMAVLQRVLYLTFQSLVNVSHSGVPFAAGELGELRAFPRILLYMCDQPEERAVLCLKSGMCQMPCSSCDVHVADMATETALKARSREPLITVERQLEAHGHRAHGRESQRRAFIEKTYSINSQPPALAAMAGMCTPPFLLHRMIACDVLHVSFLYRLRERCNVLVMADLCRRCAHKLTSSLLLSASGRSSLPSRLHRSWI